MGEHLQGGNRRTALALAKALLPSGNRFEGGGEKTLGRLEEMLAHFGPEALRIYQGGLVVLEQTARLSHGGRAFSSLTTDEAERYLTVWTEEAGQARRALAAALVSPLKVAHFDDPGLYDQLKCSWRFSGVAENHRWMEQVTRGPTLTEDLELECDAVVVGTGAGGAIVAKELAERGHAVVMLEEGAYHTRADFNGEAIDNARKFYRDRGLLTALGNAFISVPVGKLVGGSTAVNTATCWRTPERILRHWVDEGLEGLSPEAMAPFFERVEKEIQVEPADARYLGGAAKVLG
ncbi:MAG: GMC family oxidoreductase N-terminal domain-containing protein, partial [Myxococcaceae bacterium]